MPEPPPQAGRASRQLPNQVAVLVVGALLLGTIALLPFVVAGVVGQIVGGNGPNFAIFSGSRSQPDNVHLNAKLTGLDEWNRNVTILVSGIRVCDGPCTTTDRIQLVSIPAPADRGYGLPPYETIAFPPNQRSVSQEIKLPISGDATRYPFDHYRLELAVVIQRVAADGTVVALSPQAADGALFMSVTGSIPKTDMDKPVALDASSVPPDDPAWAYAGIADLNLGRPLYLRGVTVLLVLLVSLAAVYVVAIQPFESLAGMVGFLVLGIWGLRAILLGADVPGYTALDLSLMVVILFLLLAITWRGLIYLRKRSSSVPPPSA